MRKLISEALGTFAIVFCGTGAVIVNEWTDGALGQTGIAITFGFTVMAMIYAFGEISGAHFNPAVSIAFAVSGKFPYKEILPYILSQVTGGIIASLLLRISFPENDLLGTTLPSGPVWQSFVFETILTFLLMLVILNVSSGSKEQGMFAGLAIGSVILLEALFAGPVSGASMNPARSLSPAIISGHLEHLWIYLTAPVTGAILSVFVWRYLEKGK